jgi:phosphoglycerate kinase
MAAGQNVGASLVEADMVDTARAISDKATAHGCHIDLPVDFLVATELARDVPYRIALPGEVAPDEMILDAGPQSVAAAVADLAGCRTIVWNGPMGAFEFPPFDSATNALARAVAETTKAGDTMSVAGGGDTLAALANAGVSDQFSYVSTAGGAFLEWLEGRELPGVEALRREA